MGLSILGRHAHDGAVVTARVRALAPLVVDQVAAREVGAQVAAVITAGKARDGAATVATIVA